MSLSILSPVGSCRDQPGNRLGMDSCLIILRINSGMESTQYERERGLYACLAFENYPTSGRRKEGSCYISFRPFYSRDQHGIKAPRLDVCAVVFALGITLN